MAKSERVWNLRLNLDEFNGMMASIFTDSDRALLLQGLSLGCNGGDLPGDVPRAFESGWEFGHAAREEADEYKARQAEKGKASASARRDRAGTAQPVPNQRSNRTRTSVRTEDRTGLEPTGWQNGPILGGFQQNAEPDSNQCSNQRSNQAPNRTRTNPQSSILNPITTNENPSASKASLESPRAHEEPPPPVEPPTQPIADDATDDAPEGSGPSPALLAFAARLAAQRGDSAFGLGAAPVVRAPTPPAAQAPKAPPPAATAAEKARLEALPGDKRPSREDFTRFASIIAPKWRNAGAIFDEWAIRNWTIPPKKDSGQRTPQRIRNWRGTLQYEIAGDDNPKHWTDMLPMGHLLSKGDA